MKLILLSILGVKSIKKKKIKKKKEERFYSKSLETRKYYNSKLIMYCCKKCGIFPA